LNQKFSLGAKNHLQPNMSWNTTNLEIALKQILGLEGDKEFKQANGGTRI
jgi:hypothetical protein